MKNNNYISHVLYLKNSTAYDHDFWYTCVKWWYLQAFFSFFKILIFGVVSGGKGQKIGPYKFCLLHSMSQEPYIIWSSFVILKCKMIISPGFFSFSKFWFLCLLGRSRTKKVPKWQKNIAPYISGTIHHMSLIYGTHVWKDNISRSFNFFPRFNFWGQ